MSTERPLSNALLCHQLVVWLSLCPPDKFENALIMDMLATYFKKTKMCNQPKEQALSDKQYAILYNLYSKWRVSQCFKFADLKFQCILLKDWTIPVLSASGQTCEHIYFETKNDGILTQDEFIEQYGSLRAFMPCLLPSQDEDFL